MVGMCHGRAAVPGLVGRAGACLGLDQHRAIRAPLAALSSEPKCNTPADLIIGTVDQDLRECCHAMLFAFVG